MALLTTTNPLANSSITVDRNDTSLAMPELDLDESLRGSFFSRYAWQAEGNNTILRHNLAQLPAIWPGDFRKHVCIFAADSTPPIQQSNAPTLSAPPASTDNPTFANGGPAAHLSDLERVVVDAIKEVLDSRTVTVLFSAQPPRYLVPKTPVAQRIDQLILEDQGDEELLLERRAQAEWVKHTLARHWALHLPQPFIGFDSDEGLFVASWESDAECNTLTIDAREHKGWYDPWPAEESDNPLPDEIDLNSEAEWQRLRIALTTTLS